MNKEQMLDSRSLVLSDMAAAAEKLKAYATVTDTASLKCANLKASHYTICTLHKNKY
jgi:hypothetical protein